MDERELTDAERAEVGRVFESHQTFIAKIANQFAPSPDVVPDIVQAVGLKLCRGGYRTFQGRSQITTWLFSVTRSIALTERRSITRRDRNEENYRIQRPADPVCDPDLEVVKSEERTILKAAIDALPKQHRTVLRNVLRDSGVIQEKADRLRACRARAALRSMMRDTV